MSKVTRTTKTNVDEKRQQQHSFRSVSRIINSTKTAEAQTNDTRVNL
jgi:hypothetical protein